ncbi:MAG: phosphotransferase [Ideonella sp.]|nr:phosphotransferase [Ideonella sp.]MCC7455866.1 phosphotransferase [Nitrospira sp.]
MSNPIPACAGEPVTWVDAQRQAAFTRWLAPLAVEHNLDAASLAPASADASFRRYLRIRSTTHSFIVMDAPPPHEDVRPFVDIARRIGAADLHAPRVLAADASLGFLLLDDLGRTLYLDALRTADAAGADRLMREALAALVTWQKRVEGAGLPRYGDALLRRELALFPEWCVQREHGLQWSAEQQTQWQRLCDLLVASALAQPTVVVHRDWMPRNLMVCEPNPGILDFQDAVVGPVTYDVASMLRDAFISWDEERELDWAVRWWQQARATPALAGHAFADDFGECWRALEWMGLQRHLKVLGIFCRLKHRDGKAHYATDLPRFFAYATRVALRYRPLAPLLPLIEPLSGQAVRAGYTF